MATKSQSKVFRSFEQLKSELFPNLSEKERRRSSKWSPTQIGAHLADEAIEDLLKVRR